MHNFTVKQAAALLGVSDDTVRRWMDAGRLGAVDVALAEPPASEPVRTTRPRGTDRSGRRAARAGARAPIDGARLAALAQELAADSALDSAFTFGESSARNRLTGLVTRVVRDGVMAQVEVQAGPFRVVSLMSREAADELGLEPGVLATATMKATTVVVELPGGMS